MSLHLRIFYINQYNQLNKCVVDYKIDNHQYPSRNTKLINAHDDYVSDTFQLPSTQNHRPSVSPSKIFPKGTDKL